MKIYTKTGDKGVTSLFNGKKVKKSNKVIEALGAIDELNAGIGTLKVKGQKAKGKIFEIQSDLMEIAAQIAGYRILNLESRILDLEKEIDMMEKRLPKLTNFILPRSQIHVVRAVCRRAERIAVRLKDDKRIVNSQILKYLNRLSDYLFVLARDEDYKSGKKEIIWKYGKR